MEKNNKIQKEENKNFDYLYFARAYLLIAFLGAQKLIEFIKISSDGDLSKFKNPLSISESDDLVPDFVLMKNYLLAPILYNIKHAIEIFLKSMLVFLGDGFEKTHDIKSVFFKVKKKLSALKLTKAKKQELLKKLEKLEVLVIKYYQNLFLKDKITDSFDMEDISNNVFRYPDNTAKICFDFFNIFPKFQGNDVKEIQNEMKEFYGLFYDVGIIFLENKHGPRFRIYEVDYGSKN